MKNLCVFTQFFHIFSFSYFFHVFPASFDVYNIETALPVIDLEAIENHLKAAKEEERRVSYYLLYLIHAKKDSIYDLCFPFHMRKLH